MKDLACSLGSRRSRLSQHGFLVARKSGLYADLVLEKLRTALESTSGLPRDFAFVFTGQGTQCPEMSKGLFAEFLVFRDAVAELDVSLDLLPRPPSWSLKELIHEPKATSIIMDPLYTQTTCTAFQEIVAAFAAGFATSVEAIRIAYYRGYVIGQRDISNGAMMAIGLS